MHHSISLKQASFHCIFVSRFSDRRATHVRYLAFEKHGGALFFLVNLISMKT
jgi:hypothetical protein